MEISKIQQLAESMPPLSEKDLESRIQQFREAGWTILGCIAFVCKNQRIDLKTAKDWVLKLPVWADHREGFWQHQDEMAEAFLDYQKENIESIKEVYTPEGTTREIRIKPQDDSKSEKEE